MLSRLRRRLRPERVHRRRIALHRSRSKKHERDLNLQLLHQGLTIPRVETDSGIQIPDQAKKRMEALLIQKGLNPREPFIVIHPGSGGSSLNWPQENFVRLTARLCTQGFKVLVTGTDQDRLNMDVFRSIHKKKVIDRELNFIHISYV